MEVLTTIRKKLLTIVVFRSEMKVKPLISWSFSVRLHRHFHHSHSLYDFSPRSLFLWCLQIRWRDKKYSKKGGSLLPSFNMGQCTTYFIALNPNKTFCITSWILKFASTQAPFKLDPPLTYQEITNVIRKMKPSGSPCPLDQLSVI